MATRVITGKARLSFPHLFEPWASDPKDSPKYSVMVLIPKSDTVTIQKLREAENEVKDEKKDVWGGKIPSNLKSSIHDGDAESEDHERFPERKGHWYFTANSSAKYRPGVVDRSVQPILDQSEVYSGVYAKVSVTAFAYNTRGNQGVGLGLNNVQVLGGGDNLGGGLSAAAEFDAEPDEDDGLI